MSGSGDGHWILVYASIHMRCSATISKFRSYFIGSILATDLADHSVILNTFKDKLNGQWIKNSRRAKWRIDELNGDVHECVHTSLSIHRNTKRKPRTHKSNVMYTFSRSPQRRGGQKINLFTGASSATLNEFGYTLYVHPRLKCQLKSALVSDCQIQPLNYSGSLSLSLSLSSQPVLHSCILLPSHARFDSRPHFYPYPRLFLTYFHQNSWESSLVRPSRVWTGSSLLYRRHSVCAPMIFIHPLIRLH